MIFGETCRFSRWQKSSLGQAGVPNIPHPLLQAGSSPWPVRKLAAQQEVSCRARKGSFIATPHHQYHHLNYPLPPLPLSSIRPVPGSKKFGGHSSRETERQQRDKNINSKEMLFPDTAAKTSGKHSLTCRQLT